MGSLGTRPHRDCNAMGDAAKTTPRIPSTCVQNALLSLLIIHSIPSRQIYVAIANPSLIPSISCLTTSSHRSFRPSPVLLPVAISGIHRAQPTMFPTLNTCKATAAGAFLTCTNFEMGSKLPKFSGIVVSTRANQYSMKAPSSYWSLILNSHCSCHGRRPFSTPQHLSGRCFTHTHSFRRSPACQLWLPLHRHI
jgi:hypothetical protein